MRNKKLIAILAVAVLVLTVGAISAFAYVPAAPYFFTKTTFTYPDVPPMGNDTIFDIQEPYTDPQYGACTVVFFQPEKFFNTLGGPRDNYIGVVDEFYVVDPSSGAKTDMIVSNEGYARIPITWKQYDTSTGTYYYEVADIGVNLFDTDTLAFSRHYATGTVYLKV
jgi:hypothetical protein